MVAFSTDNEIVMTSSSGGIFSELAQNLFDVGGIVCGAAFDQDFIHVQHVFASNEEELRKLRGSKYIQSNVMDTFRAVKMHLTTGKTVLFSGTPCQVSGLKAFLVKDYPRLITVDFVCHGVASSKAYTEFLRSLDFTNKIREVCFRHKENADSQYADELFKVCSSCEFYTEVWLKSSFGFGFANNLLNRESCSKCNYATSTRVSDITLADYIADVDSESLKESKRAKSLVLINTDKGHKEFEKIASRVVYMDISLQKAISVSKHLSTSAIPHRNRRKVFKYLGKMPWKKLTERYFTVYMPERTLSSLIQKVRSFMNHRIT